MVSLGPFAGGSVDAEDDPDSALRVGGYGWGCGVSYAEDAQAFGDHIRHGGDWRYALLVARWVQPRTGGRRATAQNCAVKVSAREFAETASVGDRTVMAYLKAWNEGARRGLVPNSETIDAGEGAWCTDR